MRVSINGPALLVHDRNGLKVLVSIDDLTVPAGGRNSRVREQGMAKLLLT